MLDPRFWCLPEDPAADQPDATVVADQAALVAWLRAEVREHAHAFLATLHPAHRRLPRRALLGAFTDGVDTGLSSPATARRLPAEAPPAVPPS